MLETPPHLSLVETRQDQASTDKPEFSLIRSALIRFRRKLILPRIDKMAKKIPVGELDRGPHDNAKNSFQGTTQFVTLETIEDNHLATNIGVRIERDEHGQPTGFSAFRKQSKIVEGETTTTYRSHEYSMENAFLDNTVGIGKIALALHVAARVIPDNVSTLDS